MLETSEAELVRRLIPTRPALLLATLQERGKAEALEDLERGDADARFSAATYLRKLLTFEFAVVDPGPVPAQYLASMVNNALARAIGGERGAVDEIRDLLRGVAEPVEGRARQHFAKSRLLDQMRDGDENQKYAAAVMLRRLAHAAGDSAVVRAVEDPEGPLAEALRGKRGAVERLAKALADIGEPEVEVPAEIPVGDEVMEPSAEVRELAAMSPDEILDNLANAHNGERITLVQALALSIGLRSTPQSREAFDEIIALGRGLVNGDANAINDARRWVATYLHSAATARGE